MGINQQNTGGERLILEFLVLPEITLLILQCEVLRCQAKRSIFLVPETGVYLEEFFELNDTIRLIHRLTWWKKKIRCDS
jgi:hypothetical protein